MSDRKVEIRREADDISPKVLVPTVVTALVAIISAFVTGDWDTEQTSFAIAAAITAILGYLSTDKREV